MAIGAWLTQIPGSISSTLLMFLILFLFRVVLRKSWLAAAGFVLLFTALKSRVVELSGGGMAHASDPVYRARCRSAALSVW